jgi:hypothetical protein
MPLNFNAIAFKGDSIAALQLSNENIQEFAESLNGTVNEGVLSFKISNHEHFAIVGDWVILFDRGRDILTFSDKMFQRLFKSV